jgi:hypothetical protein
MIERPSYGVLEGERLLVLWYFSNIGPMQESFAGLRRLVRRPGQAWAYPVNRRMAARVCDDLLGRGLIDD